MTNNEKLKALMKKHRLGRRDVARLVSVHIAPSGQSHAVNGWLAGDEALAFRKMSDTTLQLLELRLANLTDKEREALEGPLDKVAVIAANRKKRACEQIGYQYADGSIRRKKAQRAAS